MATNVNRIHFRKKRHSLRMRPAELGYFLIEMALALAISSILLASQISKVTEALENSLATATGQYMIELQAGVNRYQMTNAASLGAGAPVTGFAVPLKPTTAELIVKDFLAKGFGLVSPLGLSFKHEFKLSATCPGADCVINGLTSSTTGYRDIGNIIRTDLLSVAVAKIGVDGSQSFAGSGGKMSGYAGSYEFVASDYGTVEGALGIRTGDNSGLNALLTPFYKLDGSRPLLGTMDANNNDIKNIKDITSTGTNTMNNAVINGTLLLAGTSAPGSACLAADVGKIKKSTTGDGLVICNNNVFEIIGNAVSGITAGGACSTANQLGTDAIGTAYVCNASFWTTLSNFANPGDVCAPSGKVATSIATNEQLICKNGQYMRITSLLPKNVAFSQHLVVQDGTVVTKPACDTGGLANFSLALTQSAVDVTTLPPYQSTYVAAQNNGATWTVLLRLKRSAADGGGEVSATPYGLSAVMTTECTY